MLHRPFYDPKKTYEDNFKNGPYNAFDNKKLYENKGSPGYDFLDEKVYLPFGIPAGPLLNGKFAKAALDRGFDIAVYKTVRSRKYPCAEFPNVISVKVKQNLSLKMADKGVLGTLNYTTPLSITNSFGVPSFDPDFWQSDMAKVVKYAKPGQVVIGSFQGSLEKEGSVKEYIKDFVLTAKLVKETGAKMLEVNTSCPNEGTANLLCFDIERTRFIVDAIKNEIGNTPLIIKIAYFKDQKQLETFVKKIGKSVNAISAINTIPAKIYNEKGKQALPGKNRLVSGICGYAIKWAGLSMVKRLKKLRENSGMNFVIIGVGGVTVPEDYSEYRNAGADAVMSATGAMWNPFLAQQIKDFNIHSI